jgi:hypothetical protein
MAAPDHIDADRTHVSPAEFAALRGISPKTVRRYMGAGRLPFVRAFRGGRVLIPIDALTTLEAPSAPPESADPIKLGQPAAEPSSPAAASPRPARRRGPKPKWQRR